MYYWIGKAYQQLNDNTNARKYFELCTNEEGDFQQMAVTEHSEISYFRGLALEELGKNEESRKLFSSLKTYSEKQLNIPGKQLIILRLHFPFS